MTKRKERTDVLLNLMDAPRTLFHWNGNEENVAKASPEAFDAWISQYALISNVDREKWEIFHRWDIINACIKGGRLKLQQSEEKASIVEVEVEEKASEENTDETRRDAG